MALLAEVVRSGYVESTHHGSVIALRPDGSTALALGEPERLIFPRSSNKPLQAVGLLEAGWDPGDDEELALATASHSGEPGHVEVVRRILAGIGEQALGNPAMLPLDQAAAQDLLAAGGSASALTMMCSGKHAGMLATSQGRGWPLDSYLEPDHPVQLACQAAIERLAGEPVRRIAVDGCGAPQHALSLTGLARAYGALATGDAAVGRTAHAMRSRPWFVAGTGRDATVLMEGIPGLLAKDGTEGVFAAALPDGSSVALKIQDGAPRARVPVLVAVLRALGVAAPVLDQLATVPVLGGGRPVGEVRVAGLLVS